MFLGRSDSRSDRCVAPGHAPSELLAAWNIRPKRSPAALGRRAVWEETRPTRAPDSDVAHPLLARGRVALAKSPNFNATESSLQTHKHSPMPPQPTRQTSSAETSASTS